jgi:molybdate transport system substrate-binding protein
MKTGRVQAVLLVSSLTAVGVVFGQPARAEDIRIYAAAVAKTPLTAVATAYEKSSGNKVTVMLDTAGAADQRFRADPGAALLITSVPLIRNAESAGTLRDGVSVSVGSTFAGVAVTPGSAKPDVSSREKLKAALLAAKHIAVSDPTRGATVGTHFMKVIEALGIKDEVLRKVTFASDGIETVHLVMEGTADLGVSQSSEIVQASPDALAGPFPAEFALSTEFSLWHRNEVSQAISDFIAQLTGPDGQKAFAAGGIFSSVPR